MDLCKPESTRADPPHFLLAVREAAGSGPMTLGKDRSMLVATVRTDDEAFYDFKVQVRKQRRHTVLELENVSEMRPQQG